MHPLYRFFLFTLVLLAACSQTVRPALEPQASSPDRYLIDFETAPAGRLIYSVTLGSGVVHEGGDNPKSNAIPLLGRRRSAGVILQDQQAKVVTLDGSKRLTVVRPNTSTPWAQGGRVKLTFAPDISPVGVTLNSLTLSNLDYASDVTAKGGYLEFFFVDGSSSRQNLGTTAPGDSQVFLLEVEHVKAVNIFVPRAFALDDVAFTDESD